MLFAYLDEAGLGDPKKEPVVCVAGVMLHEKQWKATSIKLSELVAKHVPREYQKRFIFHAHDMFHGTGPLWGKRKQITQQQRLEALADLLQVPAQIGFPVIHAWVKKEDIKDDHPLLPREKNGKVSRNGHNICCHAIAASLCMLIIEKTARTFAPAGDLVQVVHENNDQSRRLVRDVHNYMMKPEMVEIAKDLANSNLWNVFPVERIIDTAHFAEKPEAQLLQLADACAFVIKRRLNENLDVEPLLELIAPQLVTNENGPWGLKGFEPQTAPANKGR
jgi:hypothetical protein